MCASLSLYLYLFSLSHTHTFSILSCYFYLANFVIFISRSRLCFRFDGLSLQQRHHPCFIVVCGWCVCDSLNPFQLDSSVIFIITFASRVTIITILVCKVSISNILGFRNASSSSSSSLPCLRHHHFQHLLLSSSNTTSPNLQRHQHYFTCSFIIIIVLPSSWSL